MVKCYVFRIEIKESRLCNYRKDISKKFHKLYTFNKNEDIKYSRYRNNTHN